MLNYDRRELIVKLLQEKSPRHVNELIEELGVTAATIRRDLTYLEEHGEVLRSRGMAHLKGKIDSETKETDLFSGMKKQCIAKAALELVPNGATIALDAGKTTLALAKLLVNRHDLRVVTNSVEIANCLADNNVSTIVAGGNLFTNGKSCVGPDAESVFERIAVSVAFMGASGIRNGEFSTFNSLETNLKRKMAKCAERVIVLAEAAKIGVGGFWPFASFDEVDCLITNEPVTDSDMLAEIEKSSMRVIVADETDEI